MTQPGAWHREERRLLMFTRNIGSRYAGLVLSSAMGLVVVPFNLQYLGESAYGLWILTASITTYFSVLELGYGSATIKYVAEYRAKGDAAALNQIASTTFYLFSGLGLLSYALAVLVALLLPQLFNLAPGQERTGQLILLIIAANVALHFVLAVYGGVVNGFERNYKNFVPGTVSNIAAAAANIVVLLLGYGLVELVAVTTAIRMAPYWFYRRNAYQVFPELQIHRSHVRRERFRELTGFSAYLAVIDWSSRLTYTSALIILGYILSTAAVTIYAIAEKVTHAILKVTNQLHTLLFPALVHRSVQGTVEAQQDLLVRAARFQLAATVALAGGVAAAADLLLAAWVGPGFDQSVGVLQLLAIVVVMRTWMAMPTTLLKATGYHRPVAMASACCAVASVLLSIALVKTMGLIGVAWGMLVPVALLGAGFIFPLTCRVLDLPIRLGYARIVWPALWPALPVVTFVLLTRSMVPQQLVVALAYLALGTLAYVAIFLLWGLDREERVWMWSRLTSLRRGGPRELAAA